jgi:hypothetical protein
MDRTTAVNAAITLVLLAVIALLLVSSNIDCYTAGSFTRHFCS